jgi:hypothetical protein
MDEVPGDQKRGGLAEGSRLELLKGLLPLRFKGQLVNQVRAKLLAVIGL